MISVILAEDHHLVRQGLRALLERDAEIKVIGEVQNGKEAVSLVQELQPDIVVTDLKMPQMDGAEATQQIRSVSPDVRVIVLSMYGDESAVSYALKSGASAFVSKTSAIEELVTAIHVVQAGQLYVSPGLTRAAVMRGLQADAPAFRSPLEKLSNREKQVLHYIADGYTSAQIAQKLNLSISTVEKHRLHIMDKLAIHDVPGLVRLAIKEGLVTIK